MTKKPKLPKPRGQKHHYIPQFYLKPWCGEDYKLQEFGRNDLKQIVSRRRGPESTGYVRGLYQIPGATAETANNFEEVLLADFDINACKVRNRLLAGDIPTSFEERWPWARFLLTIWLRNPEEIADMRDTFISRLTVEDETLTAAYLASRGTDDPPSLSEYMAARSPNYLPRDALLNSAKLMQHPKVLMSLVGMR